MSLSKYLPAMHPGEYLKGEYLNPLGLTAADLALHLKADTYHYEAIVAETASLTALDALLLGKAFRTSPNMWMNMQNNYDWKRLQEAAHIKAQLESISPLLELKELINWLKGN